MQGNFEGSRTTVDILLHLISNTPAAAAAFREWLESAEEDSEAQAPEAEQADTEEDWACYRDEEGLDTLREEEF